MDRNKKVKPKAILPKVVPYVGTWIEMISRSENVTTLYDVVPSVGTWIEISHQT